MARISKIIIPDPKEKRPATIKAAKDLIEKIFAENRWDVEPEQAQYFEQIGVEGKDSPDDVRRILNDLEQSAMVIFEKK